jgi:hypothetical protein
MNDAEILREAYGVSVPAGISSEMERRIRDAGLWSDECSGMDVEKLARRLEAAAYDITGFHNWPHKDRILSLAASLSSDVKKRQQEDDARVGKLWSAMRGN